MNRDIVNELVDRGTNVMRSRIFKMLVGITDEDDNDCQAGYAKASEWAPLHDHAPETNFIAPEPDSKLSSTGSRIGSQGSRRYKK